MEEKEVYRRRFYKITIFRLYASKVSPGEKWRTILFKFSEYEAH